MMKHHSSAMAASSLSVAMAQILYEAAEKAVMPRYRRLRQGDVEEKSPGDLVTVADKQAEQLIAAGFAALDPRARFVGEEVCAVNPSLLSGLDTADAWIVDPIDGTGNYATGQGPFAMMAAYLFRGQLVAACILDPVTGSLVTAEQGAGAWRDGSRLTSSKATEAIGSYRGIVSGFMRPSDMAASIETLGASVREVVPTQRCAGAEYPRVASGELDFALYWRTLVWDHAPGVLILKEAGGKAARLDGAPYRISDPSGAIVLAHTPEIWDQTAAAMSR